MRAIVITEPGGPEALQLIEAPLPEPAVDEIRLRVAAAAVNPVDAGTRVGAFHALGWIDQPCTPASAGMSPEPSTRSAQGSPDRLSVPRSPRC